MVFEDITIMPAANGLIVRKQSPAGSYITESGIYVFNDIEEFFKWFRTYSLLDAKT